MRRLPFLLRPGWIALALVVVAFAYLCLTVLAPWQLGKNTRTSRENHQIEASVSADPVPVTCADVSGKITVSTVIGSRRFWLDTSTVTRSPEPNAAGSATTRVQPWYGPRYCG